MAPENDVWPALYARYRERAEEFAPALLGAFPALVARPERAMGPFLRAALLPKGSADCVVCLRRLLSASSASIGMRGVEATAAALASRGDDPQEAARVLVLATALTVDRSRDGDDEQEMRPVRSGQHRAADVEHLVRRPDGQDDHWHSRSRQLLPTSADLWELQSDGRGLLSVVTAEDVVDLAVLQGAFLLMRYDLAALVIDARTAPGRPQNLSADCGRF